MLTSVIVIHAHCGSTAQSAVNWQTDRTSPWAGSTGLYRVHTVNANILLRSWQRLMKIQGDV